MNLKNKIKPLQIFIYHLLHKLTNLPLSVTVVLLLLLNGLATVISVENIIQHQKQNYRPEKPEAVTAESQTLPKPSKPNYQLRINYLIYLLPLTLISMATSFGVIYSLYKPKKLHQSKDTIYAITPSFKEEALNTKKWLNKEANTSKDQESCGLLANMGHELRSPLNAILGFVQIMEQEISMTRPQKDNLAIVNRSGKRLLEIVNDLTDLAKIQTNRLRLENNSFDFNTWLDSIERSITFQVYDRGKEFELIRESNLPQYICTDERRLRQILKNLINFGLQSTSATKLTMRVGCQDTATRLASTIEEIRPESLLEHHLYFEIENQECWLTPEKISTLFEPVEQVLQEPKLAQSSSLSLPISLQLARLMGGDIIVRHHQSDRTLNFCLNIQTKKIAAEHIQIHSTAQRIIGLEPNQPQYRILIVDDSRVSRQLMLQLLKPVGFEVRSAVNGKEAVDVWLDWQPHMIWMDLRMPVMDGYEATEQIKSYAHCNIPIVAVSASTIETERQLFQTTRWDDFVGKPYSDNIIFDKIAQHLGIRYVYESNQLTVAKSVSIAEITAIMPAQWLSQVEQAADKLDQNLLTKLLEQIPPENEELKKALQRQIDNFDFDQIFTMVNQSKTKEQSS